MATRKKSEPKKDLKSYAIPKGSLASLGKSESKRRKAAGSSSRDAKEVCADGPRECAPSDQASCGTTIRPDNEGQLGVVGPYESTYGIRDVLAEQIHSSGQSSRGDGSSAADSGSDAASNADPHAAGEPVHQPAANSGFDAEQLERLRDPVYFTRAFCLENLDEWQIKFLGDLKSPCRIAIRGANGIGKTVLIAVCILYFLSTIQNCRVVIVAGVFRQLKMMVDHLGSLLKNFPGWTVLRGSHELHTPFPQNKAVWFSTDSPGAAEGQHAVVQSVDHTWNDETANDQAKQANAAGSCLILIRDECKSIPDHVKEATDTFGAIWTLDFSNPGPTSGWFYEIFSRLGHIYKLHHIKASDSSYVTDLQIKEFEEIHGKESARYKNSIDAEFSDAGLQNIVTMEQWDNCSKNPPHWAHSGDRVGGLDISAAKKGGDECVLYWREGNRIHEPILFQAIKSEADLIGQILIKIRELNLTAVFADAGGLGAPIIAMLESAILDKSENTILHRINFGGSCISSGHNYRNRGTEMYFGFADGVIHRQWQLPKDVKTRTQVIMRETTIYPDGSIGLVSKQAMRKDGLESPDRSDGLVMCCQKIMTRSFKTFDWSAQGDSNNVDSPDYAKSSQGFDRGGI